jgi:hypothetical protein
MIMEKESSVYLSAMFRDKDLLFVLRAIMPETSDSKKMLITMREDSEILKAMLSDKKLFDYLMNDPESIIRISPPLFFTVLLLRAKHDLEQRSYTIERESRHRIFVFDSKEVVRLLDNDQIIGYLGHVLSSFVRVNSYSIPVRIRKGVWRKFRFNDFDVDSLIKYSGMIDEDRRFLPYKRIADVCLFITGVFPDYVDPGSSSADEGRRSLMFLIKRRRDEFEQHGKTFYRAAARHRTAKIYELSQVLEELSEKFVLAEKPLVYLSRHYLGFFREKLFLE